MSFARPGVIMAIGPSYWRRNVAAARFSEPIAVREPRGSRCHSSAARVSVLPERPGHLASSLAGALVHDVFHAIAPDTGLSGPSLRTNFVRRTLTRFFACISSMSA
jgi:hypothetical protein